MISVAAGLIHDRDRVLVCQRKRSGPFPLKWEFPGGKLKEGEGYVRALRRELREELGIEIESATEVFRHRHAYPGPMDVALRFFRIDGYRGVVANRVFEQITWALPRHLEDLDFLEADLPLVKKLARREL